MPASITATTDTPLPGTTAGHSTEGDNVAGSPTLQPQVRHQVTRLGSRRQPSSATTCGGTVPLSLCGRR